MGGGRTFQKLSDLEGGGGGVRNFLLEREDKPEKGGVDVVHSGSLLKMSTVLFNLVRNTKKSIRIIFFECQCKVFLSIERILEKTSQDQL